MPKGAEMNPKGAKMERTFTRNPGIQKQFFRKEVRTPKRKRCLGNIYIYIYVYVYIYTI